MINHAQPSGAPSHPHHDAAIEAFSIVIIIIIVVFEHNFRFEIIHEMIICYKVGAFVCYQTLGIASHSQ